MGLLRRVARAAFFVFFSVAVPVASGADGGIGVDDGLHFINVLRAYDVMAPAYKPYSGSGIWLRPMLWNGDSHLKNGCSAEGSGRGLSAGCCLSTAKLAIIPLAASLDIFASKRDGSFERKDDKSIGADGKADGLGGSVSAHLMGLDLRAVAYYERVRSEERGCSANDIKNDAFHLGAYLSQKLIPLGPIGAGPELAVITTRLSSAEAEIRQVAGKATNFFRSAWSSATSWHVAPGLFVSFNGGGRSACRICGRWNWDFGHKPTVREFVPTSGDDAGIAASINSIRSQVKWPKSGYGDLEIAFCIGLGKTMFAEASVTANSVNRRGVCAALTVGKGF
ncbi:MAG: hypothetical protein LBB38_00385 [Puniceicoccales bacterium]|jgi:hypothetical protein|nr:hypothetical protein [Puniceicoccales bacterium]